ncbi:MAG: hypothetical protein ABMB14_07925 [Myxococcota bacterium]
MHGEIMENVTLDDLYFGDRDLLQFSVDFLHSEGRLTFSGAARSVTSAAGEQSRVELSHPVLVLSGLRSFMTTPASARFEAIVLRWAFTPMPRGVVGEFLLVGDPEPVTLRFECERVQLET